MNRLIRCINCDEIFLKTPFDQWPEYEFHPAPRPEFSRSNERDDFQNFLMEHCGHRLEDLNIIEDSFVSEKAYIEPIKISYCKATNGRERFVIKKSRERIDEPLKYQLIPGDYCLNCVAIEIQSKEIGEQLEREFKATPFPKAKIAAFLKLYRNIAETSDIRNLERVPEDSFNPLEIYYRIEEVNLFYLLRNCRNIFKGQEYLDIEEFICRHKDDGVLLLKATYEIQIIERVESQRKPASIPIPLEGKKVMEKK